MEQTLIILGSFISLLLMVNAYFTRETLQKITKLELRLVEFSIRHDYTDERSRTNQLRIEKLELEFQELKNDPPH